MSWASVYTQNCTSNTLKLELTESFFLFVSAVVQTRCWPLRTVRVSITWSTQHTGLSPSQPESSSLRSMFGINHHWIDKRWMIQENRCRGRLWKQEREQGGLPQYDKDNLEFKLNTNTISCLCWPPVVKRFNLQQLSTGELSAGCGYRFTHLTTPISHAGSEIKQAWNFEPEHLEKLWIQPGVKLLLKIVYKRLETHLTLVHTNQLCSFCTSVSFSHVHRERQLQLKLRRQSCKVSVYV